MSSRPTMLAKGASPDVKGAGFPFSAQLRTPDNGAASHIIRGMLGLNMIVASLPHRTATFALALGMSSSLAFAQSLIPDTTANGASKSGQLEEIVVTAQRRSERLQDVPVAVTSLTSDTLAQQGVTSTKDLAQAVPSLVFLNPVNFASPAIRGVRAANVDPTAEAPVAIYIDDVYMAASAGNLFTLPGIKQIDVLNGPQGTLFGRNATGGVIMIQTLDPADKPHVDLAMTYASYGSLEAKVYASTGIGEGVATSLAAMYENQGKGYGQNLFDGSEINKQAVHNISLRNIWLIKLETNTKIRISADYSRIKNTNTYQRSPGAFSVASRSAAPTGYPGEYDANVNLGSFTRNRAYGVSAKIDQDLGSIVLTSISAYRRNLNLTALDQDISTATAANLILDENFKNFSQEIRLQSVGSSNLKWVVGAYYYNARGGYRPLSLNGQIIVPYDEQKTESFAVFGQATFALSPHTNLTSGIRFTHESQGLTFPGAKVEDGQNFQNTSYRFAIDHHLSGDALVYASYNTGFKSGGFNLLQPGNKFKPEKNEVFEIGLKTEWFNHTLRLNVDAFYSNYTDQQVSVSAPGGSSVQNAAGGRIKGADANFDYVATDRLKFSGGLTWMDAYYTDYPGFQLTSLNGDRLGAPVNVKGNELVAAPDFVGNISASYRLPTRIGAFFSSVGVQYNGGFEFDPGNQAQQRSYTVVNASFTWRPKDGPFDLKVWGRNLLDSTYYVHRTVGTAPVGYAQIQAPPRSFGLTLSYNYD